MIKRNKELRSYTQHISVGIQCSFFSISLVWFYGVSTIVGYLMPNPFLYM